MNSSQEITGNIVGRQVNSEAADKPRRMSVTSAARLIRLSVGLEDSRDLISDFEQSFEAVGGGAR
jgi:cystathionine beta-lyase/cystathionine gamma-synthase